MKTKALVLAALVFACTSLRAETINFKSGKTLETDIIERTDEYIIVDIQGTKIKYYLDEIKSLSKNELSSLSPDFQNALQQTKKSIVKILAFDKACSGRVSLCSNLNLGTGFIIRQQGLVATNCHVLAGFPLAQIWLDNKTRLPLLGIVAYDLKKDICILKIDPGPFKALDLLSKKHLNIGDRILAIGYPLNTKSSLFKNRSTKNLDQNSTFYQGTILEFLSLSYTNRLITSAEIEPGVSGGPFINSKAQVVGIAIQSRNNKGIAVSVDDLLSLKKNGIVMPLDEFSKLKGVRAQALNAKGKYAQSKGKLSQAISYYKQSLDLSNDNIDFYFDLGMAYEEKGLLNQSISVFEKISKKEPGYALIQEKLAYILAKKGHLKKALEHSKEAIKLLPNYPEVYANHGLILSRLKKDEESISFYQKALELDPKNLSVYVHIGNSHSNLGEYEKGMKYYEKAIDLDPNYDLPYHNVGKAYLQLGLYTDAITFYKRAIEKNPGDAQSYLELGISHYFIKDFIIAETYFQKAKRLFERQGKKEKAKKISQYLKKPSIADLLR